METKDAVGNILNDGDSVVIRKTHKSKRDVQNTKKR